MNASEYTTELRDRLAAEIALMLQRDASQCMIPSDPKTWEELHDHVDANEYLLGTDFDWQPNEDCYEFSAGVEIEALRLYTLARAERRARRVH